MAYPTTGKTQLVYSFIANGLLEFSDENGVDKWLISIHLNAQPSISPSGFHGSVSVYPENLAYGCTNLLQDLNFIQLHR